MNKTIKNRIMALAVSGIMLAGGITAVPVYGAEKDGQLVLDAERIGQLEVNDSGNVHPQWEDESLLMPKSSKFRKATLPPSFDLRANLPAIRDQGDDGNCWSYGALASLESSLINKKMKNKSVDLSENHLTWFTYHGANNSTKSASAYAGGDTYKVLSGQSAYRAGGNCLYSSATLARWYGAVDQSIAPSPTALSDSLQTRSDYRLKNMDILPNQQQTIKQYLQTKCVVDASYYAGKSIADYKQNTAGQWTYYTSMGQDYANHEIAIVGWDDNVVIPGAPGNGGWLVRNSWGDYKESNDGYFWLSYYDKSFCDASFFEAAETKYPFLYQYDGVGVGDGWLKSDDKKQAANRYTARNDVVLSAVGIYSMVANPTIKVSIYLDPSASDPTSGTKVYSNTFTPTYAGYHTLDLKPSIGVISGRAFSVVICISYKDGSRTSYALPFECAESGSKYVSLDYKAGQSFLRQGSGRWQDITKVKPVDGAHLGNALVKAYGKKPGSTKQTLKATSKITKTYGSKAFTPKVTKPKSGGKLYYKSSNVKVATISSKGKVTLKGPGRTTLTVKAAPTSKYKVGSKTITLTVKPKKMSISSAKSTKRRTMTVKWKKNSKLSGYQVMIAKNRSFKKCRKTATIKKSSAKQVTFKGLKSRQYYYVKMRAYKTIKGKKVYGAYSAVKRVRIK